MKNYQLTIPNITYTALVNKEQQKSDEAVMPLGISKLTTCMELLVKPFEKAVEEPYLRINFVHQLPEIPITDSIIDEGDDTEGLYLVNLFITSKNAIRGYLHFHRPNRTRLLDTLKFVGPEMMQKVLTPAPPSANPPVLLKPVYDAAKSELGDSLWQHFTSLRYGLIGCSSTGSLIVEALARSGVKHISLVDPSPISTTELSTIAGATLSDIGHQKVDICKSYLESLSHVPTDIKAYTCSPTAIAGIDAIRHSDLVISCSKSDSTRLFISMVCALYLKPLIDISSGPFNKNESDQFHYANLFLPGDECCPYCSGTLNKDKALATFSPLHARNNAKKSALTIRSMYSDNYMLSGITLQLIEGLLENRIKTSTNLVLRNEYGAPKITYSPLPNNHDCPVCALSGFGTGGIKKIPQQLQYMLNRDISHNRT